MDTALICPNNMDENPNVVKEPLTPAQPSEGTTQGELIDDKTPPAPGSKTPPELLLKSLQQERDKVAELEEELNTLKSSVPSEDVFSDEGKLLKKQISTLEEKISTIEEEKNLQSLYNQYPLLRDKANEFVEYRKAEHPRAKLESVAKLFLAENDLLEPKRKGLEKPTGGTRTPQSTGMTYDEAETLMKTDYRKYRQLLKEGKLNPQ